MARKDTRSPGPHHECHEHGVNGLELDWFASYLNNRKQFCKVNGVSSGISDINCGVPQGSYLGPLLFLIYINDLPFSLEKAHVSMYADDTTISHSSKSLAALQHDLNCDLSNLQDWLHGNKLSLNVIKTQSLIIGSGPNIRRIQSQPDYPLSFEIMIILRSSVVLNILVFKLTINSNGMTMLKMQRKKHSELLDWSSIQRNIFPQ